MTLELDDYRTLLEGAVPQLHNTLDGIFHEAARQMSPAGLHNYLEAARGLAELGRGSESVINWLEEMPLVAREIGEDIIPDALEAAMKLSSMTS